MEAVLESGQSAGNRPLFVAGKFLESQWPQLELLVLKKTKKRCSTSGLSVFCLF